MSKGQGAMNSSSKLCASLYGCLDVMFITLANGYCVEVLHSYVSNMRSCDWRTSCLMIETWSTRLLSGVDVTGNMSI